MKAIPVVKKCCCGCSLEFGSKIFAWLEIVGGVLIIIIGGSQSSENSSAGGKSSIISVILNGILAIVFGVFLLKAIQKKRPDYINIWVVFNLIGIVLYIISAIVTVLTSVASAAFLVGLFVFIYCAIQIALTLYSIVVVSSFRKEMVASIGV